MLPFLAALALLAAPARDEFSERLAALSSPRSEERAAAQRWLESHLEPARFPALAEAALAGDAELRQRLVRALGHDGRNLALALAFQGDAEERLAALGREAVQQLVAEFDARLGEVALRGAALERRLQELAEDDVPVLVRVDPRQPLERVLEGLELFAELPLGLSLDARLAGQALRRESDPIVGRWDDVVVRLARALGLGLEGHALGREGDAGASSPGFLRFTAEPETVRATGVSVIGDWLRIVDGSGDAEARARAARNLASAGFVPALGWLEGLARERSDPAALAGLVRAAGLGQVSAVLLEPGRAGALLDAALGAGGAGARSAGVVFALTHLGCFDARGAPLVPGLFEGFDGAGPRSRWGRLVLGAHLGCADAGALAAARATLLDGAGAPALRRTALAALVALGASDVPGPPAALELFREPLPAAEAELFARQLARLALAPPARAPADVPEAFAPASRRALFEAWLEHGDDEVAGAHLARLAARSSAAREDATRESEALARLLEPRLRRGQATRVAAVLGRARTLEPRAAPVLDRLTLLLGLAQGEELAALLERLAPALSGPTSEPGLQGALAGRSSSGPAATARAALLEALGEALRANRKAEECAALIQGLERAASATYAAGRDAEGAAFARDVRRVVSKNGPRTELGTRIERTLWPLAPGVEVRDIVERARAFEVPADL